jgi:hypothetical protein
VLELCRRACRTYGPPLLEALAAVDRAALRRFERDRSLFAALRANGLGFDALGDCRTRFVALRTTPLARLAPFGFVFKSLVNEEHLLAGGENKLRTTVGALENFIVIFHTLLRDQVGEGSGRSKAPLARKQPPDYGGPPARTGTFIEKNTIGWIA